MLTIVKTMATAVSIVWYGGESTAWKIPSILLISEGLIGAASIFTHTSSCRRCLPGTSTNLQKSFITKLVHKVNQAAILLHPDVQISTTALRFWSGHRDHRGFLKASVLPLWSGDRKRVKEGGTTSNEDSVYSVLGHGQQEREHREKRIGVRKIWMSSSGFRLRKTDKERRWLWEIMRTMWFPLKLRFQFS